MMLFICIWLVVLTAIILLFWRDTVNDLNAIKEYVQNIWGILPSRNYYSSIRTDMCNRFDELESNLTTEIACLATKNNEDIKRMKGDYAVGDILRFDGVRWRVFGKDTLGDGRTRWKLFGENEEEYRMYTDSIPEGIEFLGHRDLSFD